MGAGCGRGAKIALPGRRSRMSNISVDLPEPETPSDRHEHPAGAMSLAQWETYRHILQVVLARAVDGQVGTIGASALRGDGDASAPLR